MKSPIISVPTKTEPRGRKKECLKDMKALGINSVSKYARATDYIKEIISQVQRLQAKDFAYKIEGDGLYFNISKFKNYGKLAGRTVLDAEDSVSRIDYGKDKKNRGDFCLWKFSSENEPSWPAPFGSAHGNAPTSACPGLSLGSCQAPHGPRRQC